MIRYDTVRTQPLTRDALHAALMADAAAHADAAVQKAVAGWLGQAVLRTAQLVAACAYIDQEKWKRLTKAEKAKVPQPLPLDWADIKYLFREIQYDKCAYCERKLPSAAAAKPKAGKKPPKRTTGSGEHDLEHFRTKNAVNRWPPEKDRPAAGDPHDGYYWLAFELMNYCTSCITCNRERKGNYFPIAGAPGAADAPVAALNAHERPLLIYPLGTDDDDPEEVIRFKGIAAFPPNRDPLLPPERRADAHRNRRAEVIIEFFDLNSRPDLLEGRAIKIRELEKSLADINKGSAAEKKAAADDVARMTHKSGEHSACVNAMIRLYQANVEDARKLFENVQKYLATKTPNFFTDVNGFLVAVAPKT